MNVIQEESRNLDELFGQRYEKIKRLAVRVRWNGANPTLNPTALVHEAYVKLRENPPDLSAKDYDGIIRIFSRAMRQILIDAARRKDALNRLPMSQPEDAKLPIEDAIGLNDALDELERENPRLARIAECRFVLG